MIKSYLDVLFSKIAQKFQFRQSLGSYLLPMKSNLNKDCISNVNLDLKLSVPLFHLPLCEINFKMPSILRKFQNLACILRISPKFRI